MRGKKEVVWTVVISAALITAGLILSCGDDDGGSVNCNEICEKFVDECEFIEGDVDDCVDECDAFYDDFKDIEGAMETFECAVDTRCGYILVDCFCKAICEKYLDCEYFEEEELFACMGECAYASLEEPSEIIGWTVEILDADCDDLEW